MPAAILPQLRPGLRNTVRYPTAPAYPPTHKDVAGAAILSHEVYAARRQSYHRLGHAEY